MPAPIHITPQAVRRFLLAKQNLWPTETAVHSELTSDEGHAQSSSSQARAAKRTNAKAVLDELKKLECVQLDPVAAVERNQHLALQARIRNYRPGLLEALLQNNEVFEYWANAACIIPMDDYPIFEGIRRGRSERLQPELDKLGSVVDDVLQRLEREGPLPAKAFETTTRVHGYWDNTHAKTKSTSHALNLLNDTGRIQVVKRQGTTRFFDLRERAIPGDLLDMAERISEEEAASALFDKYLRAYRVFDLGDARFGWQRLSAAKRKQAIERRMQEGTVAQLDVEGVKRPYFVLVEDLDALMSFEEQQASLKLTGASQRVSFLPPLDNLLWRRERIEDLFGFSYTWEVYTPPEKRKYGYYAMPILVGDKLIGRIDPRLNRESLRLDIRLLHLEASTKWTKSVQNRVYRELEKFARFHGATLGEIREVRHGSI